MEKIELSYPIKINGVETKELTIRRPKVRDRLVASKQGETDQEIEAILFANLTEMAAEDFNEMDEVDYQKIQGVYSDFFVPTPETSDEQ